MLPPATAPARVVPIVRDRTLAGYRHWCVRHPARGSIAAAGVCSRPGATACGKSHPGCRGSRTATRPATTQPARNRYLRCAGPPAGARPAAHRWSCVAARAANRAQGGSVAGPAARASTAAARRWPASPTAARSAGRPAPGCGADCRQSSIATARSARFAPGLAARCATTAAARAAVANRPVSSGGGASHRRCSVPGRPRTIARH
ncbi:hypothetical protein D3C79_662510 [compost metagenome]